MNPKYEVHHSKEYEDWVRKKPCLVCKAQDVHCHHVYHARRNSYLSVPLCQKHHVMGEDAYHAVEKDAFEKAHNMNLDWEIIKLLSEYLDLKYGEPIFIPSTGPVRS